MKNHEPRPDRPIAGFERTAAWISCYAGGLFVLLLVGLHVIEPEYDPTWRFVSEYALGRFGWMMSVAFGALAISLLGMMVAVARHVRTVAGYIGLVIIAVAGAGLLIAAVFVTDPITTASDAYSVSGRMHVLGASLDWSPIGMVLSGWALGRTAGWRRHRRALLLTAAVPVVLTLAFTAALPHDGHYGPGVYAGLIGRLLLVSYLGWIVTVSRLVLRLGRAQDQPPLVTSAATTPQQ